MYSISFKEFGEKLNAGESIEEIAKEYRVYFDFSIKHYIPINISVEKLIEIVEKVPELFPTDKEVPAWLFFVLIANEKFDIVDNIVSGLFEGKKYISEKGVSTINSYSICKPLQLTKQITTEQILVLLSIMEKRKDLLSKRSKNNLALFFAECFLKPLKDYLSEEHLFSIFAWVTKETNSFIFKHISDRLLKKLLPVGSQFIQEKLVEYFISAHPSWIVKDSFDLDKVNFFKEGTKRINTEIFIPSVIKFYPKLHDGKKVYLLNFPLFLEKYPQLAVKSLKAFIGNIFNDYEDFIVIYDKIFIPNEVWDIMVKKEPLLFLELLKKGYLQDFFSFDIDYVAKKAELFRFVYPEESEKICSTLKRLYAEFHK